MGVKRPPKLGPPKYKEGEWVFYCHGGSHEGDLVISIIQIINVSKHFSNASSWYDYSYREMGDSQSWYLCDGDNIFKTLDEALAYWKRIMEEQRLTLLVAKGIKI